jgi:hypothetical protein
MDANVTRLQDIFKRYRCPVEGGPATITQRQYLHFAEFKPTPTKAEMYHPKLQGFHHSAELEKLGVIRYVDKVEGIAGCFDAKIKWGDFLFNTKSNFPPNWSLEDIAMNVGESWENITSKLPQKNGYWEIMGLTNEGMPIVTIMNSRGQVITMYPLIKI